MTTSARAVPSRQTSSRARRWFACGALVCAVVAVVWLTIALRPVPQLGSEEETLKAVDALFTAVNAHDSKLVEQCATQLTNLRQANKIGPEPYAHLESIIAQSREARWRQSSHQLYDFMMAQRQPKR